MIRASSVVNRHETAWGSALRCFSQLFENFFELSQRADALVEALSRQNGELYFGDVEPAPMLGRVMDLELLGETTRLLTPD